MNDQRHSVNWSVRLAKPPKEVYPLLSTDHGRSQFWAETTRESDGAVAFEFPSGEEIDAQVLETNPPEQFKIKYFGTPATFTLSENNGGTILEVNHEGIDDNEYCEMKAGWVSVLLTLKARVDHSVDLRNHDTVYCWENGFVGN